MYAAAKARNGQWYPVEAFAGEPGSQEALASYVAGSLVHIAILHGDAEDVSDVWGVSDEDASVLADGWFDAGTAAEEGDSAEEFSERLFAEAAEADD